MSDLSIQLRVTSVRSRGKFGGVIFAGTAADGRHYVAVGDHNVFPDAGFVDRGQDWIIRGALSQRTLQLHGVSRIENQIAVTAAELIRPAGRNVIDWIAGSNDCSGIGRVKASKLYDRFGPSLIELIEQKNIDVLSEVINKDAAALLCRAFEMHKVAATLLWLDHMCIPRRIGSSVMAFYKDQAQAKIEANPYVLVSFEANWRTVDEIARDRFGIVVDDSRRLHSAVEEALYRGLRRGHTGLPENDLKPLLVRLLGSAELAQQALMQPFDSPQYRQTGSLFQPAGLHVIESYIAEKLTQLVLGENGRGQQGLFANVAGDHSTVAMILDAYERDHRIVLSQEQRDAVLTSANSHLSLILGGAGTGKTTVLKALYAALESLQPGLNIYQLALAGRAAQRMAEATARESMTVAGFLTKVEPSQIDLGAVIVIDEASMIDVILMYRLLRHIPPRVKLILVGDPSQLPPIGPGLVLHALAKSDAIPQIELKVVKRQSAESGIPQVAAAIRNHQAPRWTKYRGKPDAGVSLVPCPVANLDETVLQIYSELGGAGSDFTVQILSITKAHQGGVQNLNKALHDRYRQTSGQIQCFDAEFGLVGATTLDRVPLKVGDLIIYGKNDYELGLRNGSLGRVLEALPIAQPDDPCCRCEFEGVEFLLTTKQLQALDHAYSITVHKSQGSQFARVIVPVRESRLLDQALIYTAVTRGIDQVVLIGDDEAILAAIEAPAFAARRHIALPTLLGEARA